MQPSKEQIREITAAGTTLLKLCSTAWFPQVLFKGEYDSIACICSQDYMNIADVLLKDAPKLLGR